MNNIQKLKVSFSESQLGQATNWADWELEDLSYCLGFGCGHNGGSTVVIRDVLKPNNSEMARSRYFVDPYPEFLCRLYDKMQATGADFLIQSHTHPFCDKPAFSGTDDVSALRLNHDLRQVNPRAKVVQVVYGRGNSHFKARILSGQNGQADFECLEDIEVIGPKGIQHYGDNQQPPDQKGIDKAGIPLGEERNARAFGDIGVEALHNLKVLILGTGGLGSAMAYLLSRLGFRMITVYDQDRIDETNINRFYFVSKPKTAIGKFKASFVAKSMRVFNRLGKYRPINASIFNEHEASKAVKNADLVITTLDSDGPRLVACSLAARYGKPLVNVSNAIYLGKDKNIKGAYVSCQWFIPREEKYPCLRCQGALNDKAIEKELMSERLKEMRRKVGYVVGTNESPNAQVIPINSAAAGIAAWEIALWATGTRAPTPWIHYDLMNNAFQVLQGVGDQNCTICGITPASCLATGDADLDAEDDTLDEGRTRAVGLTE